MSKPDQVGRLALGAAGCVWVAAWAGRAFDLLAIGGCVAALSVLVALRKPAWSLVAVLALAGSVSGMLSSQRDLATLESVVPELDASWTMPFTPPRASARTGST